MQESSHEQGRVPYGMTAIAVVVPGVAQCQMAVPIANKRAFCMEARKRGLLVDDHEPRAVINYRLRDREGIGIVLPEPGETIEQAEAKLRAKFGDKLMIGG